MRRMLTTGLFCLLLTATAAAAQSQKPLPLKPDVPGMGSNHRLILKDGSWLLVRFSGTEPVMRIYTETTDPARVQRMLDMGETIAGVR